MRIAFVINNIRTEKSSYTTLLIARKMHNQGHEVYLIEIDNFIYTPEGHMAAFGLRAKGKNYKSSETFLASLLEQEEKKEKIISTELDILMLRNDPAAEEKSRSWAATVGLIFGQIAMNDDVLVLNDPSSLSHAANKMYFQHFPEQVRPNTLITRDVKEIREFFHQNDEKLILKPLVGSGGKGVFLVKSENIGNLNQIIEALGRDGYIIAQEYMPEAAKGDTRLFVMNGKPLFHKGKYAALKRVSASGDIRSNVHSGGTAMAATVTDEMIHIVEIISPKLLEDGMFLVGLDIVGSKLLEINVFSPGGLVLACKFADVDFAQKIIDSLVRKVEYRKIYGHKVENKTLATLN
jgi:glutathione synthase